MMRKCFLHIGTHKTGTCSIQWNLSNHRAELAKHGFLYPRSGTGFPGHHNVAWEIAEHRYHDPKHGTVDELITEIGQSEQDVIMSSEDFILSFPRLANFQSFIERLKQSKLQITIIVYLRNPPDYFRSAYFEILKNGCPVGFARFIAAMIENKTLHWGQQEAGGIDTIVYLQQLATDKDIKIIPRSYDRVKNSVVADFLSVINLTLADLGIETEARHNEHAGISDTFGLFYQSRTGRPPDAHEAWLISCLGDALDGNDIHMRDRAKQMLLARYENQAQFLNRYGISEPAEPATAPGDSSSESDIRPYLEDVFSETTVRFIEKTALRLGTEFQTFKSVQPAEISAEITPEVSTEITAEVTQPTSVGYLSMRRRFWYQLKPFLPPIMVSLAKSFYYGKDQ